MFRATADSGVGSSLEEEEEEEEENSSSVRNGIYKTMCIYKRIFPIEISLPLTSAFCTS